MQQRRILHIARDAARALCGAPLDRYLLGHTTMCEECARIRRQGRPG